MASRLWLDAVILVFGAWVRGGLPMREKLVAIVVSVMCSAGISARQTSATVDYDTFCRLPDTEAKTATLSKLSPENSAELVRARYERFLFLNKSRLNHEQVALIGRIIANTTPDAYSVGQKAEAQRKVLRELGVFQSRMFTPDDHRALMPAAPCISKS